MVPLPPKVWSQPTTLLLSWLVALMLPLFMKMAGLVAEPSLNGWVTVRLLYPNRAKNRSYCVMTQSTRASSCGWDASFNWITLALFTGPERLGNGHTEG